jgi:hypothetical protein
MKAEAARMRGELSEAPRTAGVGDPGAKRDLSRNFGDRPVWHAEDDQVGVTGLELTGGRTGRDPLAEPGGEGFPDASCADDARCVEHSCSSSSVVDTGRP